jgi:hypothetical protein
MGTEVVRIPRRIPTMGYVAKKTYHPTCAASHARKALTAQGASPIRPFFNLWHSHFAAASGGTTA